MDDQKQTSLPPQDGTLQAVNELQRRTHTLESSASRGVHSNVDGSYDFYDTNNVRRLNVGKLDEDNWGVRRYSDTGGEIVRPHFLLYNPLDQPNQTIGGGIGVQSISWSSIMEEVGYTFNSGTYIFIPRPGPWEITVQLTYSPAGGADNLPFWMFINKTSFVTDNPSPTKRLAAEIKSAVPGTWNYIRATVNRIILANELVFVDHISNNASWNLLNGDYDTYIACTYLGED